MRTTQVNTLKETKARALAQIVREARRRAYYCPQHNRPAVRVCADCIVDSVFTGPPSRSLHAIMETHPSPEAL